MSCDLANLKYNETFSFRDGTAKFLSKDDKSGTAWINYNGQLLKVDYNDLFGINTDKYLEERKEENLAGIDQRIASAQASYEKYCSKIEAAKMTYKLETEKENFFTKLMAKILGDKKDATQLSGIKAREYQEAEASRSLSRKLSSSASSDIFSYAISAADEAYYKNDLVCQRSLAEAMMG